MVEIAAPPTKPAKEKPAKKADHKLVEGSLSAAFHESGDVDCLSPFRIRLQPAHVEPLIQRDWDIPAVDPRIPEVGITQFKIHI